MCQAKENNPTQNLVKLSPITGTSTEDKETVAKLPAPKVECIGCCAAQSPEGEWKDVFGDPVRPRRNGYEWPPDLLQATAWIGLLVIAVLHYMVQIPFLEGALFIVVLVISSIIFLLVIAIKAVLELLSQADPAVFDPNLPRLTQEDMMTTAPPCGTMPCFFCRRFVALSTKHCSVCDKCVPGFDHHCRWLNSCIGEANYRLFAVFIGAAWVGTAWLFAISVYLIQWALRDIDRFKDRMEHHVYRSSRRAFPAIMVFNFVVLALTLIGVVALAKLICFHIYLFLTNQTTYENIMRKREKKKQRGEYKSGHHGQGGGGICGCCGLHRRRDFKKHGNNNNNNNNNNNGAGNAPVPDAAPTSYNAAGAANNNAGLQLPVVLPYTTNVAENEMAGAANYLPGPAYSQREGGGGVVGPTATSAATAAASPLQPTPLHAFYQSPYVQANDANLHITSNNNSNNNNNDVHMVGENEVYHSTGSGAAVQPSSQPSGLPQRTQAQPQAAAAANAAASTSCLPAPVQPPSSSAAAAAAPSSSSSHGPLGNRNTNVSSSGQSTAATANRTSITTTTTTTTSAAQQPRLNSPVLPNEPLYLDFGMK